MNYYLNLFLRLLFCFTPISLIYLIFTPLTIYSVSFFLFNYSPAITDNILAVSGKQFTLVEACIAGYAYYLLLLLLLLTKDIKLKLRLKLIFLGFLFIFIMNIIRITILLLISLNLGQDWFNLVHLFFWRFVSGIFIALVWIFLVKHYKIKSIPVWSDIKYLYNQSIFKTK